MVYYPLGESFMFSVYRSFRDPSRTITKEFETIRPLPPPSPPAGRRRSGRRVVRLGRYAIGGSTYEKKKKQFPTRPEQLR